MELSIRPVRPEDAEAIVGILNPIIQAGCYTVLDTPLTVEAERAYIVAFPPRGVFYVAEEARTHRLVGLQSAEPYATYTHAFDHVAVMGTYVDLALRRQGIGRRLSEVTFAAAREKGFEKILTYVRADNGAALSFYLQLGFRIIGTAERQARCGGAYVDEVLIEKFL